MNDSNAPQEHADHKSEAPSLPKIIDFDDLPRCGAEVWITSNGQLYRLRRTRQGKLVLTK